MLLEVIKMVRFKYKDMIKNKTLASFDFEPVCLCGHHKDEHDFDELGRGFCVHCDCSEYVSRVRG